MRVLLDTDVILDLLLDRAPFADAAAALWLAHEREQLNAYIAAITPINLFYIARKLRNEQAARQAVVRLFQFSIDATKRVGARQRRKHLRLAEPTPSAAALPSSARRVRQPGRNVSRFQ